ncbi:hypothetical protein JTB14_021873 [Gonioctena quinquepunctata]|nr:hypothetical protein JTB14_021873 [Gonioctena quinquepunctata]
MTYCFHGPILEFMEDTRTNTNVGGIRCYYNRKFRVVVGRNVSYLSHGIHDECIALMANEIKKQIIAEVKDAVYYPIIVDSTPDMSHVDQLTFILRYVSKEVEIKGRFLGFFAIDHHDGINNKSPGLQCTGDCRKFYHGKCVDINKQDLNKFLMHGVHRICPRCRDVTNNTSIVIGTESNDTDMESGPSSVTMILKDIQENLRSLNKKHEDVMDSVNFCSNQISTFETAMNRMNEKIA